MAGLAMTATPEPISNPAGVRQLAIPGRGDKEGGADDPSANGRPF